MGRRDAVPVALGTGNRLVVPHALVPVALGTGNRRGRRDWSSVVDGGEFAEFVDSVTSIDQSDRAAA